MTYLFRGIGQNIQPLTADEMERITEERVEKIRDLGLSGLMTSSLSEAVEFSEDSDSGDEREEIMEKVVEDLEDFGQLE